MKYRRKIFTIAALSSLAMISGVKAATSLLYHLNIFDQTGETITTDGRVGELSIGDITYFNINLGFPHSGGTDFQPDSSVAYSRPGYNGSGILANSANLYFDFGSAEEFGFRNLLDGSTLQFKNGGYMVVFENGNSHQVVEPQIPVVIASAPEPSTWGLLMTALFGMGALMRVQRLYNSRHPRAASSGSVTV